MFSHPPPVYIALHRSAFFYRIWSMGKAEHGFVPIYKGYSLNGEPIKVFNNGDMQRDFTYISDIVEGLVRVIHKTPEPNGNWNPEQPDPASSIAPYRIYNIGNSAPIGLNQFIEVLENVLKKPAIRENYPMQTGDVHITYADAEDLFEAMGYRPEVKLDEGVKAFADWFQAYYQFTNQNS